MLIIMMLIRMLSMRERGYYFTVMVLTLRPPLHIQPGRPANHTEPPDYPKAAASSHITGGGQFGVRHPGRVKAMRGRD